VERRGVTDPDDARGRLGRVVQDTLPHIVVEVRAVVVCFDGGARRVVRVGVEGVEVCADALHGGEVLDGVSS
jgi:hypothetical protein